MATGSSERASRPGKRTSLSRQLLGGSPNLTARQVADLAGTPLAEFDAYWLASGFPPVDPDKEAFTDEDMLAYRDWSRTLRENGLTFETGLSMTRARSHLTDRLVLWQVEALVEQVQERHGLSDSQARIAVSEAVPEHAEYFEAQLIYSWRRQMHGLLDRISSEVAARPDDHSRRKFPLSRALGFVDMVSYTSNSSHLGDQLVGLIEKFEYSCRSAVAAKGGRVVKMIGDAVFFIADDLATGLDVVTHLVEDLQQTPDILPVRASLVMGDVFSRSGDVFGPPVNLAARLVDIAPTGQILTDARTAAMIASGEVGNGYRLSEFPSTRLRGVGRVSPYLVSVAQSSPPAEPALIADAVD